MLLRQLRRRAAKLLTLAGLLRLLRTAVSYALRFVCNLLARKAQ